MLPQRRTASGARWPIRHRAVGAAARGSRPARRGAVRRSERHLGFDTFDLPRAVLVAPLPSGDDGRPLRRHNFRYAWPAELDLMARIAGLELERRVADWDGSPFTSDSESHVSVWRKP